VKADGVDNLETVLTSLVQFKHQQQQVHRVLSSNATAICGQSPQFIYLSHYPRNVLIPGLASL